jgi:hypothetical protein
MQIRRAFGLCVLVALVGGSWSVHAQRNDRRQQQQREQQAKQEEQLRQQDIETLVLLVDAVSAGQQEAPADVPLTWESNHFIKGQGGDTYVPFTLSLDRSQLTRPDVALYVRIVDKEQAAAAPPADAAAAPPADAAAAPPADAAAAPDSPPQRPTYAWDNLHFIDIPADGKVSRAIALRPGEYDAFITIKERAAAAADAAPAKVTMLRRDLSVPDFSDETSLTTSSVILASDVQVMANALPASQQEENPYVFGPMRIVPSVDGRFSKNGELQVIFWIYGARPATGGKPDVQVEFDFHHRLPEGEKYFNRTAPQELNAETLPPEFSVAAGHQLPGSLVVPLQSFPTGDYRLEIKITDNVSGQSTTQNVNFTVLPV